MAYALGQIARRAGEAPGSVTLRIIEPTKTLSDDLARLYLRVVRLWRDEARNRLLPVYVREVERLTSDAQPPGAGRFQRDEAADLERQIIAAEAQAAAVIAVLSADLNEWMFRAEEWHADKFAAYVKSGTGVSVDALMSQQAVRDAVQAALAENIGLITSVSDQTRLRISEIIWRGFQARTPRRVIAREINHALDLGRKRSLRISVDQTTKLSAALDRARQQEAGMEAFNWRHSGKVNYRPEHKARNGKLFKWSSAVAKTDPPGQAVNCACKAAPVLVIPEEAE